MRRNTSNYWTLLFCMLQDGLLRKFIWEWFWSYSSIGRTCFLVTEYTHWALWSRIQGEMIHANESIESRHHHQTAETQFNCSSRIYIILGTLGHFMKTLGCRQWLYRSGIQGCHGWGYSGELLFWLLRATWANANWVYSDWDRKIHISLSATLPGRGCHVFCKNFWGLLRTYPKWLEMQFQ